jgi:hypothetical protein
MVGADESESLASSPDVRIWEFNICMQCR